MERTLFFGRHRKHSIGVDIEVYSTDSYVSIEECEPVAEQIAMSGADVLPILLSSMARSRSRLCTRPPRADYALRKPTRSKKPKANAAVACGPSGLPDSPPSIWHRCLREPVSLWRPSPVKPQVVVPILVTA